MRLSTTKTLIGSLCGAAMLSAGLVSCAPKHNTLSEAEIADGWQLLFDGKTLDQWKDFNGDSLTQPWTVVDGCIQAKGGGSDLSGYIVTKKEYENFILDWEWKLSHGGNSGMLYHVVEDPYFKVPYVTGPEYQLIDEEGWEEENAPTKLEEWQRLGVDYAMHLPDKAAMQVNPQGEWNSSRIVFDNGHVEHWLNGKKILEFEAWTDDWFARKHSGKWETAPEYGLARKGVICLQDHGDPASFRNIKIKELPARPARRSRSSTARTSPAGRLTARRSGMWTRRATSSAKAVRTSSTATWPRATTITTSTSRWSSNSWPTATRASSSARSWSLP